MKTYELTYIISLELTKEEAEMIIKEIESFIEKNEGIILKRENLIAKTLSYSVKGQSSGFLNVVDFQLNPEKLNELEKKIKKEEKILRHMILIKNPEKKLKIKRGEKKFKFALGTKDLKTKNLNKEEFSFTSPFSSAKAETSEDKKNIETAPEDKNDKKYNPDNKKTANNKPEKIGLKNIEKKLDEILGE